MLNLSDKELDRLAREAANEYDPGDLAGPGSWDRMQLRLDNEMGFPRLDLFRSIRRMSFYYAPAILMLAAISYYLFRPSHAHPVAHPPGSLATVKAEPSGSPPVTGIIPRQPTQANADRSVTNQNTPYRSTSTPASASPETHTPAPSRAGNSALPVQPAPDQKPASNDQLAPSQQLSPSDPSSLAGVSGTASPQHASHTGGHQHHTDSGTITSPDNYRAGLNASSNASTAADLAASGSANPAKEASAPADLATNSSKNAAPNASADAPLSLSVIRGIHSTRPAEPVISDAGLRKLGGSTVAKSAEPINPGKKRSPSLHIDRPLQIGISLAPDFTSVNSLAGDKPGSDIGITADYQLFNKWHLHTGFLLAHRNYTAAQQDYHVPDDYYRMNNMHDVYFVKGTINLYEIPLDVRYDFSVTGNTSFFVSGGLSSYLLTHENCNYYFDLFGRNVYQEFKYNGHQNSLFSTVDLSIGVETGLSNSLSLLVAPFMKIPTTGLGFGRIEMNTIGVEFGLKYAPVLRRRRH